MNRILTISIALFLLFTPLHAQWVQGGSFSSTNHFQACAFHQVDTGLFVYGTDNPGQGEGGIIITWSGMVSSGAYIWYGSPLNLEDIDVKMGDDGKPIYLAAGHLQYNYSVALHPYLAGENPLQFDSVHTGSGRYYRALRMRSDIVAFAAGGDNVGNGIIDMSTDTGYTWTNMAVLPGQPVSRLHFVNDQLGFAACGGYRRLLNNGVQLADSGAIYRTVNGGLDWLPVHASNITGFSDVAFLNEDIGVAARSDGAMLRTIDGGDTWIPASVSISGSYVLTSVTFRSDGLGFASAYMLDGTEGLILTSDDDGETWYEQFSTSGFNNGRRIYDLYFFDEAHGYACTHMRPLRTNGIVTGQAEPSATTFSLRPNPTSDEVVISLVECRGDAVVEVVDPAGRIVRSVKITAMTSVRLPVLDLLPGSYVVRVRSEAGISSQVLLRM